MHFGEYSGKGLINFQRLRGGEMFSVKGENNIYIKTSLESTLRGNKVNAMKMKTGALVFISRGTDVYHLRPLNGEMKFVKAAHVKY